MTVACARVRRANAPRIAVVTEIGAAFLIDENGTIVFPTDQVTREFERDLGGMIECLLEQEIMQRGDVPAATGGGTRTSEAPR